MTGKGIIGWLAGALGALVIVAVASVLAPSSQQGAGLAQSGSPDAKAPASAAPAQDVSPAVPAQDATPAAPAQDVAPAAPAQDVAPAAPAQDVAPAAPAQDVVPAALAQDVAPAAPAQDVASAATDGDALTPPPEPQPKAAGQAALQTTHQTTAPAVSESDAAPIAGTEPAPRVSADQTSAPTAPAVSDAPAVAASEIAPGAGKLPQPQALAAAESAPGAEAAVAPDVPVVQNAAPEAPTSAAVSADEPRSPAAADAAPQVAEAGAAQAAPPASDTAPAAEPAPQHDALLEPAAIPALGPDAGTAPARTTVPGAPAIPADGTTLALPQLLAPSPTDAPDAAPKPGMTATIHDNKPSTLPSVGRLADRAAAILPRVKADALPQIGKTDTGAESLPQIGKAAAAPEVKPQGPMQNFARAFTPAAPPKPLFAILLRDIGDKGMPREELLKLPFAVSIVLDPMDPGANDAMQAWRGAGQEVVMAMGGLPVGAEPSDVAQTFQALSTSLPQAVALIDANGVTFQNDRPLASLVVSEVQSAGMGLVTFDEGLDAADQIARRNGVPAAQVFRRLDGKGEGKDVIRRYLDRATFKAAQEGAVVVLGDTSADTVAAILEWSVEGKASGMTLAPLTAVLGR